MLITFRNRRAIAGILLAEDHIFINNVTENNDSISFDTVIRKPGTISVLSKKSLENGFTSIGETVGLAYGLKYVNEKEKTNEDNKTLNIIIGIVSFTVAFALVVTVIISVKMLRGKRRSYIMEGVRFENTSVNPDVSVVVSDVPRVFDNKAYMSKDELDLSKSANVNEQKMEPTDEVNFNVDRFDVEPKK